ncbi:MAG: hypothetical protein K1Y36_15385 [Blastocatellia bacterium]|nr:hypothetical protein [Blastocatellia bacterium]
MNLFLVLALVLIQTVVGFAGPQPTHTHSYPASAGLAGQPVGGPEEGPQKEEKWNNDKDFKESDETQQTFEMAFGATVEIHSINGSVAIEPSVGNQAEVRIIRRARFREDLNFHKIKVENSNNTLKVYGEHTEGKSKEVRQQIFVKIPRQMNLTVRAINGRVGVGELEGPVKISAVNGKVELANITDTFETSSVNGNVVATVRNLDAQGIKISGINGKVEIRLADGLNANLNVNGINGNVRTDAPNITVEGKVSPSMFRARLGNGGASITISGVNGLVVFGSALPAK